MNKNAILLSGSVVLCVVVVIVMNFIINKPERSIRPAGVDLESSDVVVEQPVTQIEQPLPEEKNEPQPTYEATVNNGTILF
ncbi:MAG: hypothetical protein WCY10_02045 [Candidatus Omnitrophota bacterium]